MVVSFRVEGTPEAARRPRFARIGGHVRTYDPKENVSYKQEVKQALLYTVSDDILRSLPFSRETPLVLKAVFQFPRPKSHYGTGRNSKTVKSSAPEHHIKKPDLDNLLKIVKDALKNLAWHDDSQICEYAEGTGKFYTDGIPYTEISIYPKEGSESGSSDAASKLVDVHG